MNLDRLDNWLAERIGNVAARAVEDWVWLVGALIIAGALGFRP